MAQAPGSLLPDFKEEGRGARGRKIDGFFCRTVESGRTACLPFAQNYSLSTYTEEKYFRFFAQRQNTTVYGRKRHHGTPIDRPGGLSRNVIAAAGRAQIKSLPHISSVDLHRYQSGKIDQREALIAPVSSARPFRAVPAAHETC